MSRRFPLYVARRISLSGMDWLKVGLDLWLDFGCLNRDYFVFVASSDFWQPIQKFASTDRVGGYVRLVFAAALKQPHKSRLELESEKWCVADSWSWSHVLVRAFHETLSSQCRCCDQHRQGSEGLRGKMACQLSSVCWLHPHISADRGASSTAGESSTLWRGSRLCWEWALGWVCDLPEIGRWRIGTNRWSASHLQVWDQGSIPRWDVADADGWSWVWTSSTKSGGCWPYAFGAGACKGRCHGSPILCVHQQKIWLQKVA